MVAIVMTMDRDGRWRADVAVAAAMVVVALVALEVVVVVLESDAHQPSFVKRTSFAISV